MPAQAQFFDADVRPPRGGWHFENFKGHSPQDVGARVKAFRQNNGTFTTDAELTAELWRYWCGREPARCRQSGPAVPDAPHKIGWKDVLNFGMTVVDAIRHGTVPQQEAERRAAICATGGPNGTPCPHNVALPSCARCTAAVDFIKEHMTNLRTPSDESLHSCGVCGCYLPAAVHVSLERQQKILEPGQKEQLRAVPWCWKKEGL